MGTTSSPSLHGSRFSSMTAARKATSTDVAGRMQYLNPMAVSLPAPDGINRGGRRMFRATCCFYVWIRRNNLVGKTFAAPFWNHGISCNRDAVT